MLKANVKNKQLRKHLSHFEPERKYLQKQPMKGPSLVIKQMCNRMLSTLYWNIGPAIVKSKFTLKMVSPSIGEAVSPSILKYFYSDRNLWKELIIKIIFNLCRIDQSFLKI